MMSLDVLPLSEQVGDSMRILLFIVSISETRRFAISRPVDRQRNLRNIVLPFLFKLEVTRDGPHGTIGNFKDICF